MYHYKFSKFHSLKHPPHYKLGLPPNSQLTVSRSEEVVRPTIKKLKSQVKSRSDGQIVNGWSMVIQYIKKNVYFVKIIKSFDSIL